MEHCASDNMFIINWIQNNKPEKITHYSCYHQSQAVAATCSASTDTVTASLENNIKSARSCIKSWSLMTLSVSCLPPPQCSELMTGQQFQITIELLSQQVPKEHFKHFQSLEQHASGTKWLTRYDFLLVFCSKRTSRCNCCWVISHQS